MEFKKFNHINEFKKFCNHFYYNCLYYRHTHYGISQRQHVFRVYVIHSNCARSLFLYDGPWWKWLFTFKNVSRNDWKLKIGVGVGVGIKMSWVKKIEKLTIGRGGRRNDYSGLESIKRTSKTCLRVANELWVLLLGAENKKLGRLEKHICR